MGSILNNVYQAHLSGQLAGLPANVQSAALSSVAVAASVAQHLPSPLGAQLLRSAQDAYVVGMSDVMLITALFLPAHAPKTDRAGEVEVEVRRPVEVAS